MKEPKTKTIGNKEITVQPWPARKAWTRQITLGKVFGPALEKLGAAIGDKGAETDVDLGKMGLAFNTLFQSVSESEADNTLKLALNGVRVDGKEIQFEALDNYLSDIADIYKVFAFVMEVNYGSFLGENGIGKLLKKR